MLAFLKRRSHGLEFSITSVNKDLEEKDTNTPVDKNSDDTDKVSCNGSASKKAESKTSENSEDTEDCTDKPLAIKEEPVPARTPDYDEIIVPEMVMREARESISTEARNSTSPNSCIKQVKLEQVDEEPVRELSKLGNVSQYHQSIKTNPKIYQQQVVGGPNEPLRLCDLTKLVQTAGDNYENRMQANALMNPENMDGDMMIVEEDDEDTQSMDSSHNSSGGLGAEKKRRKPVPLNTLCPICGNPAPGHSHFGGEN